MTTIEVVPNIPAEEVQKFYRAAAMLTQARELAAKAAELFQEVQESGKLSISIETIPISIDTTGTAQLEQINTKLGMIVELLKYKF